MNKLKIFLIFALMVLFVSIPTISAFDFNETQNGNELIADNLTNINIEETNTPGTFNELQKEINNVPMGSTLDLTRDYNGNSNSIIHLNKDLTIDGHGHTLNCKSGAGGSAFYSDKGNIILKNLIITNTHNTDTEKGGAIYITGTAQYTLENCTFYDNHADSYGGAIYSDGGKSLTIKNCTFKSNSANDDDGGAIYSEGEIHIENSIFDSNKAYVDGGAIFSAKNIFIDNCIFKSNSASGARSECYGGAIRAKDDVFITNCTFENNNAEDYGGAIYADNVNINIQQKNNQSFNSFFINNKAADDKGGAIYASYNVKAINTLFKGNSALVDGGAIYAEDNVVVNNCLFESNKADGASVLSCYGGAIRAKDDTHVINSTFKNNYAENRGGAIYSDTLALEGATYFENNIARDHGGAIYTDTFRKDIKNATFINNNAQTGDGGAIYIDSKNYISISECEFINNKCKGDGGAIYVDSSSSHLWLTKNIFSGNSAGTGQSVYNWGAYEQISCNFWTGKNPNSNNDQLIRWGLFSDDHYSDSNPIKLDLVFDVDMDDNYEVFLNVKVFFFKSDNTLFTDVFDISDINFTVTVDDMPAKTRNEEIDRNSVSFDFTPHTKNLVSVHYRGYNLSKLVTIEYSLDLLASCGYDMDSILKSIKSVK